MAVRSPRRQQTTDDTVTPFPVTMEDATAREAFDHPTDLRPSG